MAFSEITGTEAISTTEHSLATDTSYDTGDAQTTEAILQVVLDLDDMVQGDILQIRIYDKCRSGDTQRVMHEWVMADDHGSVLWVSPAIHVKHGWDVTADALAGTITINWSLRLVVAS
jgi:hypothetical protein